MIRMNGFLPRVRVQRLCLFCAGAVLLVGCRSHAKTSSDPRLCRLLRNMSAEAHDLRSDTLQDWQFREQLATKPAPPAPGDVDKENLTGERCNHEASVAGYFDLASQLVETRGKALPAHPAGSADPCAGALRLKTPAALDKAVGKYQSWAKAREHFEKATITACEASAR